MSDTVPPSIDQSKPNPETTFIYALLDPNTQDVRYIGKANNPQTRLEAHLRANKNEKTYKSNWIKNLTLQGLEPILKIVEEVPTDIWKEREMYWIQYYHNQNAPLTNGTAGGDGMQSPTPEVRAKLSQARKGKKRPPEVGAKVSAAKKGQKHSDEAKAKISASRTGKKYPKISASMKGKKLSPESIEKRSSAVRGKKRPPEVGAKVSATKTGTSRSPFSEEWRRNIGKSATGRVKSPETRAKIAASRRGKKHSPETLAKMSQARKKRSAIRKSSPPDTPTLWDNLD